VPWCETCDRFYNPNTLTEAGDCPTCGRHVADAVTTATDDAPPEKLRKFNDEPTPWHFRVLVGGVGVYLAFRLVQGIAWVAHRI